MKTLTTTLNVRGMTCGGCVRHVGDALRMPGVLHVDVNLRDGLVVIEHDPASAPTTVLVTALASAGFEAALENPSSHARPSACCSRS